MIKTFMAVSEIWWKKQPTGVRIAKPSLSEIPRNPGRSRRKAARKFSRQLQRLSFRLKPAVKGFKTIQELSPTSIVYNIEYMMEFISGKCS